MAVTCHIVPTLPEAWAALCKTTCARYVRPRCDALHPLPPRCRLRVHWRAGWEASRQQPRATSHRPSLPPSVHQSVRRLSLRPCVPAGSGVKRRILSCGRGRASLSVTLSTLKSAASKLPRPPWCQGVRPRPPGTRGFGPGLIRAPWRRAQTPATANSAAVSLTLTTQANASPSPSPNANADPTPHHPGSLSAFEKECVDKYDIRIDEQVALTRTRTRTRTRSLALTITPQTLTGSDPTRTLTLTLTRLGRARGPRSPRRTSPTPRPPLQARR